MPGETLEHFQAQPTPPVCLPTKIFELDELLELCDRRIEDVHGREGMPSSEGRSIECGVPLSMYFWRIEKLKTEMVARPLSEREVLPYLVVYVGLYTAVGCIPPTLFNVWDWLGAVWSVVLAVVGTIYIYRRNGGSQGQHFLQRYFVVGWVVTIRWLVIIIPALLVFFAALSGVGIETEETAWYEFVFAGLAEAVVYWRIGHHVGDLANRTRPG